MTIKEYREYEKKVSKKIKDLQKSVDKEIKNLQNSIDKEIKSSQTILKNVGNEVNCNVPFGIILDVIKMKYPNTCAEIDIFASCCDIDPSAKNSIKNIIEHYGGSKTVGIKCTVEDINKKFTFETSVNMQTKLYDDRYFVDLLKITNDRYGVLYLTMSSNNINKIMVDMAPNTNNYNILSTLNLIDDFIDMIDEQELTI